MSLDHCLHRIISGTDSSATVLQLALGMVARWFFNFTVGTITHGNVSEASKNYEQDFPKLCYRLISVFTAKLGI
jgi:hypothetical protein